MDESKNGIQSLCLAGSKAAPGTELPLCVRGDTQEEITELSFIFRREEQEKEARRQKQQILMYLLKSHSGTEDVGTGNMMVDACGLKKPNYPQVFICTANM